MENINEYLNNPEFLQFLLKEYDKKTKYLPVDEMIKIVFGTEEEAVKQFNTSINEYKKYKTT